MITISLSTKITALIVTASMGLFLTAVAILCVLPLIQAAVDGRRPELPDLPAVCENLGIALAIGGFTFQVTEAATVGVALALLGGLYGFTRRTGEKARYAATGLHPILEKAMLVCGVLSLGALGELYYLVS
jgi:hypothetical protein